MEEHSEIVPLNREPQGRAELMPAASYMPWELAPREPQFRDYLLILRKHQWLILTSVLALVTMTTIASFKMKPIYEATARVEIGRESTSILPFQDPASYDAYLDMENYIETQVKILQSETLASLTIRSLNLPSHADFGGQPGRMIDVPILSSRASTEQSPTVRTFLSRLSVKRVPNSRLLDVKFESTDSQLAARVANAHIENYIEQHFRSRYETAMQASHWLAGQLDELKIKVEKAEDKRLAYERKNEIWAIDEKQNITTQKLADLNKELTTTQTDRMKKEADYHLARTGNLDAIPAIRDSLLIQDLSRKRSEASAQYSEAVSQYGPNFPKVVRLKERLKELDQLLAHEKTNIVNGLESEYRMAQQREELISQALERQKTGANQLGENLVQYNILKREAEANKQLYEGLLQKLKEAGISAGLRSSNIRVVDPALVPMSPSRPQKTRNILIALLIGLVGGVGLAFLREYLDNTVKTPDDVEFLAHLPSLAVIPDFAAANGRRRLPKMSKDSSPGSSEARVELVSHTLPRSQVSEAFRSLRTALLLSRAEQPPQVILVTSPLPQEGKTTTAVNLAVTLAQLGDRTLLVDADLRKPGITQALGLGDGNYAGLSSYLAGVSSLELVTVPHPVITSLAAIPTGPTPPNSADLLSSRRLSEAIASLRRNFKFVVIDSPPTMVATDAVILSVLADGVILVARSGKTPKGAFMRAKAQLAGVKCRLLGVVLNAVDGSSPTYYHYRDYYYYGDGDGDRDRDKPLESHSSELGRR
jgi:polysaccharide biosynthesis transport protein